ncbi:DegT/DnrJ/EryC1/StrS family aminotransferase [Geobacillus jurassicus]|uniref:DegT/DnrJ/EryC1/StrS family aminotransferase n=1 Tax=Geobacillus jurassicus TaxID=235932 RepID=UPI00248193B3|nr:DegT/DnrJ/EryC1/StrS family aminotransferase [Geobacillus jurassicus]
MAFTRSTAIKSLRHPAGGMLVSDDIDALQKARFLATQARDPAPHYQHSQMGYNYRMSNIVAGIGRAQLEVLDERVKARRAIFDRYVQALGDIEGVHFMPELEGTMSNRWLTTLTIDQEALGVTPMEIINALAEENIEARPVWKPLHLQPLFAGVRYYQHEEGWSVSDELFANGLCLPSGSSMTVEEQQRVIDVILRALKRL